MRIENLHIHGFGLHHDVRLDLGPGLNVLLGPNEAGKTTLHAFVRGMLHGIPRAPNHPPLAGGNHGGALVLATDAGRFRIERTFGRGKKLLVEDDAGRDVGEAGLRELLRGMDGALYRSVFAFDLDDLSDRGLDSEAIDHRLFDAGLTGAGRSFSGLLAEIKAAKEEELRPRSGRLRDLAKEVDAIRRQLEEATKSARAHGDLAEKEEALRAGLSRSRVDLADLRSQERWWELLTTLWQAEVERRAAQGILFSLPQRRVGGPEPGERLSRLDHLQDRLERVSGEKEERLGQREDLVVRLAGLEAEPRLEGIGDRHGALLEERRLQQENRSRAAGLERSIRGHEEKAASILATFGPGWDVERALHVDRSLPRREALERAAARLQRREMEVVEASREKRTVQGNQEGGRRELEGILNALRSHGPPASLEELDASGEALAELRAALHEKGAAEQRLYTFRDRSRAGAARQRQTAPWLVAAGLGLLGALAWFQGELVLLFAALLGVALSLVWALVALAGKKKDTADPSALGEPGAALGLDGIKKNISNHAARLGLSAVPSPREIEAAVLHLSRKREHRSRWEDLERQRERSEESLRRFGLAVELAEAREAEAEGLLEESRKEWALHLHDLVEDVPGGLGEGDAIPPDAARERLSRLDKVAAAVDERERESVERRSLLARIAEWEAAARALLQEAGIEAAEGSEAAYSLVSLAERVKEEGRKASERRTLDLQIASLDRDLARHAEAQTSILREVQEILEEAGARDREALSQLVEEEKKRDLALEALQRIDRVFLERVGEGDTAERLRHELSSGERAAWETRKAAAREAGEKMEKQIQEDDRALVLLQRERSELEASTRIPELSEELSRKRAEWAEGIQRWRKAALLEKLLHLALAELHESQQPAVLRSASQAFSLVTGGRYLQVRQMMQEEKMEVLDRDERAIPASDLSRGTREQLYVSLRLGLASAFAEQGIRLPILMDDVLVNFDPERAAATAEVLAAASEAQQILLFTCHPNTADLLQTAAPHSRRILLQPEPSAEFRRVGA